MTVLLKRDDISDDVALWQAYISGRTPYSNIEINSRFDEQTSIETREFQATFGLDQTGIVDDVTLSTALKNGFVGFQYVSSGKINCLSNQERIDLFGQFKYVPSPSKNNPESIAIDPDWVQHNITTINIPQLIGKVGCKSGNVIIHKRCVKQFMSFFDKVEKAKLLSKILTFDGSWVPRYVRGSKTYLSNHSWGTAFDINAQYNKMGSVPTSIDQKGSVIDLVPIAENCGFGWGGYMKIPDGMHFEIVKLIDK